MSIQQQQEYIISALPNVGQNLAKELLKKFGSVKNVIGASKEDLKQVENLGEKKADKIKDIVDKEYQTL